MIGCVFMSQADDARLARSLLDGDVSSAWAVWSPAAESALADAYSFSGGPIPSRVTCSSSCCHVSCCSPRWSQGS